MKQLLILMCLMCCSVVAKTQSMQTIETETYANDVFQNVTVIMPDFRETHGGAKLIVSYEGDWPEEMKGAFEYAVKIWEENIPLCMPITITAKVGSIRGSRDVLSTVSSQCLNIDAVSEQNTVSPISRIKGVLLKEHHFDEHFNFIEGLISSDCLKKKDDITIIYNKDKIEEYSFALDEVVENKYDFVTLALRDIAKGLGFTSDLTGDSKSKKILNLAARHTPFTKRILDKISKNDPSIAYTNATKGSLPIILNDQNNYNDTLTLYAPTEWVNGESLKSFIFDINKPIARLLASNFGKGYVMRDLTGVDWDKLFYAALGWKYDYTTGSGSNPVREEGTTLDILPYKGTITIPLSSVSSKEIRGIEPLALYKENRSAGLSSEILQILDPYHVYYPYNASETEGGLCLSVMLNDGTWDDVYDLDRFSLINKNVTIEMDKLTLNHPVSDYARGVTGGLRYRLTLYSFTYVSGYRPIRKYNVKYFTRDYLPQNAIIKYSGLAESSKKTYESFSDVDYYVDVKVGIRNVEGTTRVMVEQLDEGESIPFVYEAKNFRKGYFIANLDRDLSTRLIVTSYNENGHAKSNTINIPAYGYNDLRIFLGKVGNKISVKGLRSKWLEENQVKIDVINLLNNSAVEGLSIQENGEIKIDNLKPGFYILSVIKDNKVLGNLKFQI